MTADPPNRIHRSGPPDGADLANRAGGAARRTDIRLLVPALVAWTATALLLGAPVGLLLVASAGVFAVAAGAAAVIVHRVRRARASASSGGVPSWAGLLVLTLVSICVCLSALTAALAVRETGPISELGEERATVTLEGVVASEPRAVAQPAGRPESAELVILRLDVNRVTGRGQQSAVQAPVLVMGDSTWRDVRWQQTVVVTGRLGPTDDPADDVVATLNPRGPPQVVGDAGLVVRLADAVRARFASATEALPADARGLMPGLVIGDTSRTPPELTEAMLTTGMTHLSAVSGSNVAIVLAAALGLCRLAGLRRRWRPLVALLLLGAFVVLVRPEPSVIRAAAMGAVGLLGLSTSRRRAGIPALAAAVLVLLCWDPWLSRSFGFALSTLATLGLLLFANPWGEVVARWLPARIKHWGPAFAIPVAAQLMCAPVIVLLQGSVSIIGIVANLLAAPLVAPATVLGVTTALLAVVWQTGASWLAWLGAVPTLGIAWVARTCAEVPMGTIPWPDGAPGALALAGLSLVLVIAGPWLRHHSRRKPLAFLSVGVFALGASAPTQLVTWPLVGWQFVMCDVGQGDGLVLSTGPGHAVVVDAGPEPDLIDGCLARLRVEVVDAVVLTHFHADHVDGLPGVLHGRTVRRILTTPVHDPAFQSREVADWAAAAQVPVEEVYAGDVLTFPGVVARVWWPARVIQAGSVPNNASVVLTVDIAGPAAAGAPGILRLALLGDIEREAAHQVLLALRGEGGTGAGQTLEEGFDIVKVAHHGSANRDDALLTALRAPVAMISVGVDNDYGHPAASTLNALQNNGFRVFRTDLSGDVAARKGDDGQLQVATRS